MSRALVSVAIALAATGCGSGSKHAARHPSAAITQTTAPTPPPGPAPKSRPFVAKLVASTHTPRVGAAWSYRVTATSLQGRPLSAQLTVQILDPLGTPHAVQYAKTNRDIVKLPFRGTFRDFVNWPSGARGYSFFIRAVVYVGTSTRQLLYSVQPR